MDFKPANCRDALRFSSSPHFSTTDRDSWCSELNWLWNWVPFNDWASIRSLNLLPALFVFVPVHWDFCWKLFSCRLSHFSRSACSSSCSNCSGSSTIQTHRKLAVWRSLKFRFEQICIGLIELSLSLFELRSLKRWILVGLPF